MEKDEIWNRLYVKKVSTIAYNKSHQAWKTVQNMRKNNREK